MHKISSSYLEKTAVFFFIEGKKKLPMLFPVISAFFQLSNFVRFVPFKKCYRVFFCALDKKTGLKKMYHTTQTRNFKFDLFYLVTSNDVDLIRGHKRFRPVPKSMPDVSSALFQSDTAALSGEASDDSQKAGI